MSTVPCLPQGPGIPCDFTRDYEFARLPLMRELERSVLGCDYGGTSWTTRRQADRLAKWLGLAPDRRLLELGAGCGWPALYLARVSGCELVMTDIPTLGLRIAAERAGLEQTAPQCMAVAADGVALPFRDAAFDRISHSDVLCCMADKLAMLRECRRVARPEGRLAFAVIDMPRNLSPAEVDIAVRAGPPFVDAPADYDTLLRQAGWESIRCIDASEDFRQSLRVSLEQVEAQEEALTAALGADEYTERRRRKGAALSAVEARVLRREWFVALARG